MTNASGSQKEEIALGLMASDRAESFEVKQFAQRMVEDHLKAGMEVKQLALRQGIALPDRMTPMQKENAQKLSHLAGKAFDRAYIGHMVKDHMKDVAEFEQSVNALKDPHVQQWASVNLPILKEHLVIAKSIADGMDVASK